MAVAVAVAAAVAIAIAVSVALLSVCLTYLVSLEKNTSLTNFGKTAIDYRPYGQSQIKCIGASTKDLSMLSLDKDMDCFLLLRYYLKISYHIIKNFMRFKMI